MPIKQSLVFMIIYMICILLLFTAFVLKLLKKNTTFDYILFIVVFIVVLIDAYKSIRKYLNYTDAFTTDTFTTDAFTTDSPPPPFEVVLVTSEQCECCQDYLKSGKWEQVVSGTGHGDRFRFINVDIRTKKESIKSLLNIDPEKIEYVPSVFIKTDSGVFSYEDDVFDSTNMIKVLKELIRKK